MVMMTVIVRMTVMLMLVRMLVTLRLIMPVRVMIMLVRTVMMPVLMRMMSMPMIMAVRSIMMMPAAVIVMMSVVVRGVCVSIRRSAVDDHVELRRVNLASDNSSGSDLEGAYGQAQLRQSIFHHAERHTGVEERADGHIPADSGKAIEIGDSH
jgi:hypothetical protein